MQYIEELKSIRIINCVHNFTCVFVDTSCGVTNIMIILGTIYEKMQFKSIYRKCDSHAILRCAAVFSIYLRSVYE